MNENEITDLARQIRLETLKSLTQLGFGHYGGSMSVVETLAVLYGAVMKIDPADPDWPERDYFVLSKGHAGPALYSTLAIKGYFPIEELSTLTHLYDAQALAAFKRLADDGTIDEIQRLSREGKLTGEVLVGQRSGEKNEA